MFVEGVINELVICGVSQDGFWGLCWNTAVILADPTSLVSESCQMIREPAQWLFGRNEQHRAAQ